MAAPVKQTETDKVSERSSVEWEEWGVGNEDCHEVIRSKM